MAAFACGTTNNFNTPPTQNPDAGPHADAAPGSDGSGSNHDDGGIVVGDGTAPEAPTFVEISPKAGDLVAGKIAFQIKVTDPDGIKDPVGATVGGTTDITMTNQGSGVYQGDIDTTKFDGIILLDIVVRATANNGLQAQHGFEVELDNHSPIASLDPPNVRVTRPNGDKTECSVAFDPLGDDAPNDGESVAQLAELRARVADRGNGSAGDTDGSLFTFDSGVKDVILYVLDDTTQPLVVDTDGDGICDDINPDIVPATVPNLSNEAATITLSAVTPTGGGFFPPNLTFGGFNNGVCTSGTDNNAPAGVCPGEPTLTDVINLSFTNDPEIYGIPPIPNAFNCTGFAIDFHGANISDGFACAAILTTDNLGNRNVSAPLRICVNTGPNSGCAAVGQLNANLPDCTGTVVGTTVTSTPCTATGFFKGGANENELISPPQ